MKNNTHKHLPATVTIALFGLLLIGSILFNILSITKLYEQGHIGTSENIYDSFFVKKSEDGTKKIINNKVWMQVSDPIFNMYIITDADCEVCPDFAQEENSFLADIFPSANIKNIKADSETGQKLIAEGITSLPAIVLSPGFSLSDRYLPLINSGNIIPLANSKYFLLPTKGNKKLIKKEGSPITNITMYHGLSAEDFLWASELRSKLMKDGIDAVIDEKIIVRSVPDAFLAEAIECGVSPSEAIQAKPIYTSSIAQELGKTTSFSKNEFVAITQKLPQVVSMTPEQQECFTSHRYAEEVQKNAAEAARLEINDLPSYIIGDIMLSPETSYEEILSLFQKQEETE
jgi:hypothetical protein